jgi:hypothetical protein
VLQLYFANLEVREDLLAGPMGRTFRLSRSSLLNWVIHAVRIAGCS